MAVGYERLVREKHLELMRGLTAAQAALWDVIDNPDAKGSQMMLSVMVKRCARLSQEITGATEH